MFTWTWRHGPTLAVLGALLITLLLLGACGGGGGSPGSAAQNAGTDNSTLLLAADDGAYGRELWGTDGTDAGTALVKDIGASGDGLDTNARIIDAATLNGVTYFAAWHVDHGTEVWKSDGTRDGTVMVAEIADAPDATASSNPSGFVVFNGQVYFAAENLAAGRELWRTDGTEAGTIRVKDIRAGGNGDPQGLTVAAGKLWFTADDGLDGRELWVSDGTSGGTAKVVDLRAGGNGVLAGRPIVPLANGVLFLANESAYGVEPAFSDGTPGNTYTIADIYAGPLNSDVTEPVSLGERVLFVAHDESLNYGRELYVADVNGATVIDILPGLSTSGPYGLVRFKDDVYFAAYTNTDGYELWRSNGLPGGTVQLENLASGSVSSYPRVLGSIGERLYFVAEVGGLYSVYSTDGSIGGARKVKDVGTGEFCGYGLGTAGGHLLFANDPDDDNNLELWSTDGTAAGTHAVGTLAVGVCDGG